MICYVGWVLIDYIWQRNNFFHLIAQSIFCVDRVKAAKYKIFRNPNNIARYTMLKHSEAKKNPNRWFSNLEQIFKWILDEFNWIDSTPISCRQEQLKNGWKHFKTDGLNSLKYEVYCFERKVLYTWILTEIKENPSRNVKNWRRKKMFKIFQISYLFVINKIKYLTSYSVPIQNDYSNGFVTILTKFNQFVGCFVQQ